MELVVDQRVIHDNFLELSNIYIIIIIIIIIIIVLLLSM